MEEFSMLCFFVENFGICSIRVLQPMYAYHYWYANVQILVRELARKCIHISINSPVPARIMSFVDRLCGIVVSMSEYCQELPGSVPSYTL